MSISTTSSARPFSNDAHRGRLSDEPAADDRDPHAEPPRVDEEAILASAGAGTSMRASMPACSSIRVKSCGFEEAEERVLDGHDSSLTR